MKNDATYNFSFKFKFIETKNLHSEDLVEFERLGYEKLMYNNALTWILDTNDSLDVENDELYNYYNDIYTQKVKEYNSILAKITENFNTDFLPKVFDIEMRDGIIVNWEILNFKNQLLNFDILNITYDEIEQIKKVINRVMYNSDNEQKEIIFEPESRVEEWQDKMNRLYNPNNEKKEYYESGKEKKNLSSIFTFQVTDDCNLACSYCYQINKGKRIMKFEDGKRAVDMLLSDDPKIEAYISSKTKLGIVIEFIGGEPFLATDVMDEIITYFYDQAIKKKHRWAILMALSICSNGTLYNTKKVQDFLHKWRNLVSFSITIDGDKPLHDSCRKFPDGSPSYDIAVSAAMDWVNHGYYMGSKITIAPENLQYLCDSIYHMVELGYKEINANCVYEKGWTIEHARDYYIQLEDLADYWIDNDIVETHYLSLFKSSSFRPISPLENSNWCGGTGDMLSLDPDGRFYPCIRYMESSLGTDVEPYHIGNLDEGIGITDFSKERLKCLNCISRITESSEECYWCPIAEGCSWCSAYNYQENGTPDSRVTYICDMHKSEALANCYFWNRWLIKNNYHYYFKLWVPKEWALEIIDEEKYNELLELSDYGKNNGYLCINSLYKLDKDEVDTFNEQTHLNYNLEDLNYKNHNKYNLDLDC